MKVLDDFGLLTNRDPTEDEIESFEGLQDLTEGFYDPLGTRVQDEVISASIVTLNTIMGEDSAAMAIEKVAFLKFVSIDFSHFSCMFLNPNIFF